MRHLIYHCCPLVANSIWRRNLKQLGPRAGIFDTAVVAIATGDGCHDLAYVVERIDEALLCAIGDRARLRFLTIDNDPRLREVASFELLLDAVRPSCAPGDAVFYAHTKGNSTADGVQGATRWRNAMYDVLLNAQTHPWERLSDPRYLSVGACKMIWHPANRRHPEPRAWRTPFPSGLEVPHRWIFAGTFFWFSAEIFERYNWRAAIQPDRYGAEAWLGHLMPRVRGLSVLQPRPEYEPWNPYDPAHYGEQYDDPAP